MWLRDIFNKVRMDPELKNWTNEEIRDFLLKKYDGREILEGRFYNNSTQENQRMTQEQFINMYLNEGYILSGYATMYKNQKNSINISSAALENLGDMRKKYKKKMEASEHGSDDYIYYKILQLTYKVLMNSYYGILGEKNSIFYNSFTQNSITKSGQALITTSIVALETFLTNNTPFEDTDDAITFMMNVKNQKAEYNILDYIDTPISNDQLFEYIKGHFKPGADIDEDLLTVIIYGFEPELCSRIFYKNQILLLVQENSWFRDKLAEMLQYRYEEQPEEAMKPILDDFKAKVLNFCFYDYLFEDRYKRAVKDKRKSIITIDTDSNFINLDNYVKSVTKLFVLDKKDAVQQMTVMNIFVSITTDALKKEFWLLTKNLGIIEEARPIINMKSEFVYSRILLTENKKNYAGIVTAELGKLLKKPVMDIKGLPILKKTSVPKTLRKQFSKIVKEDILEVDNIDILNILKKYDEVEASIDKSLHDRKTEYLLPKNLEVMESYKTPEQIEAVRGMLIWNALEPENQIVPPEKINIIKLNCQNEDDPRLLKLKETYPKKYKAIMERVFNHNQKSVSCDISRFGFTCIAIPKGIDEIPEYLIPFIDYRDMTVKNMTPSYILLKSLGIFCTDNYKSNIITI